MNSENIVEIKNIKKTYTLGKIKIEAIKSISFDIHKKKFVSLVGPSGCGKTTLLNLIGGIDRPTQGEIVVEDMNISNISDDDLTQFRGNNIGFIFQNFNLIPVLTVHENVAYPLQLQGVSSSVIKEKTQEIVEAVGLDEWSLHKPNELSGGQRQRVAIARALVIEPLLVIADEPTANLDTKTTFVIMDLMKKLQKKFDTTFIFATHDPRFFDYMDYIYELEDGKIKDMQQLKKGL